MTRRVHLHATHERALDQIDFKQLKMFAQDQEASSAPGELGTKSGGVAKESSEIGGTERDKDSPDVSVHTRFGRAG